MAFIGISFIHRIIRLYALFTRPLPERVSVLALFFFGLAWAYSFPDIAFKRILRMRVSVRIEIENPISILAFKCTAFFRACEFPDLRDLFLDANFFRIKMGKFHWKHSCHVRRSKSEIGTRIAAGCTRTWKWPWTCAKRVGQGQWRKLANSRDRSLASASWRRKIICTRPKKTWMMSNALFFRRNIVQYVNWKLIKVIFYIL